MNDRVIPENGDTVKAIPDARASLIPMLSLPEPEAGDVELVEQTDSQVQEGAEQPETFTVQMPPAKTRQERTEDALFRMASTHAALDWGIGTFIKLTTLTFSAVLFLVVACFALYFTPDAWDWIARLFE